MLGDCNMYNVMIKITIKITNKTLVNQNLHHCFIRTNNSKILVMPNVHTSSNFQPLIFLINLFLSLLVYSSIHNIQIIEIMLISQHY